LNLPVTDARVSETKGTTMKLLLASLLLVSTAYAAPVQLTDVTGEFKIRCTIVRIDGDTAVLKPVDGDEIKVPLNMLSADSLVAVIKELSTRIPKPAKLAKPMLPPQEADRLNKEAILFFRRLESPFVGMEISPSDYAPVGKIHIKIENADLDIPALISFRKLKDLSQVSSLEIEIKAWDTLDYLEKLPAVINMFDECEHLELTANRLDSGIKKPTLPLEFIGDVVLPKLKTLHLNMSFSSSAIEKIAKQSPQLENVTLWSSVYFDELTENYLYDKGLDSLRFLNELPLLVNVEISQFEPPTDMVQVLRQAKSQKSLKVFELNCEFAIKNKKEIVDLLNAKFDPFEPDEKLLIKR